MKHEHAASTDRAQVFTTSGIARGKIFAVPTARHPQPAKTATAFYEALALLTQHDGGLRRMLDAAATDAEREAATQHDRAGRATIRAQLDEVEKMLETDRANLAQRRAALLAVPAAVGPDVSLDIEIRNRIAGMPEGARNALRAELANGKRDRALVALARDPLPSEHAHYASSLWIDRATKEHAPALEQLDAEDEGIVELSAGVASLRNVIS